MPTVPYLPDRSMLFDATTLIDQYGDQAGWHAATRADQSRDRGNHLHFARWRQVQRLITLMTADGAVGTVH